MPDDYPPEVLLANTNRTDKPLISEQGPDLISGAVTMNDVTFTTLLSPSSGASAKSRFHCHTLLDTGSPQSIIHKKGTFDQMVVIGAADESYVRSTTPRSLSGFGSQELLSTNRQARMTIQFYHNGTPSASFANWIHYIASYGTIRYPFLLGRDSWMRFHSPSSYQTLVPTPDGNLFGELTLL